MRAFIRDKRSPPPSSAHASKVFRGNKAKNTKPEILVRKQLWSSGLKGYRLHYNMPGRPDIAFPRHKVAIFVHGCYWHRCPKCNLKIPSSNSNFWASKFKRNVERDLEKESLLKKQGWKVLTFWECEVKDDLPAVANMTASLLTQ